LRVASQEKVLIELTWLGARFKDKQTQLFEHVPHSCLDAFMYAVVSSKRRKNFVVGLAVKVHGENGGTAALILNLLLDGGEW
jgi:hypothetical protein